MSPDDAQYHRHQTAIALQLYQSRLSAAKGASEWNQFVRSSEEAVRSALTETTDLADIAGALERSGRVAVLLRYLTTPPKSQDQFGHICKAYSKSAENSGSPIAVTKAEGVASCFLEWRDRNVTAWLDEGRAATAIERERLVGRVVPMMALQKLQTFQRMSASAAQEQAVADMLLDAQWVHQRGKIIDRSIQARHFMRKARFVADRQTKEVDVAIGLGQTFVLALECKVSNDVTNSKKRINDIREKANAWKEEYGRSLKRGGLLQGAYHPDDVLSLLHSGIEVFWSHDLDRLSSWLDAQLQD